MLSLVMARIIKEILLRFVSAQILDFRLKGICQGKKSFVQHNTSAGKNEKNKYLLSRTIVVCIVKLMIVFHALALRIKLMVKQLIHCSLLA